MSDNTKKGFLPNRKQTRCAVHIARMQIILSCFSPNFYLYPAKYLESIFFMRRYLPHILHINTHLKAARTHFFVLLSNFRNISLSCSRLRIIETAYFRSVGENGANAFFIHI